LLVVGRLLVGVGAAQGQVQVGPARGQLFVAVHRAVAAAVVVAFVAPLALSAHLWASCAWYERLLVVEQLGREQGQPKCLVVVEVLAGQQQTVVVELELAVDCENVLLFLSWLH